MNSSLRSKSSKRVSDKVVYTGEQPALYKPFKDGGLPIKVIKNGYAYCVKPDGYLTTWMGLSELQAVDHS